MATGLVERSRSNRALNEGLTPEVEVAPRALETLAVSWLFPGCFLAVSWLLKQPAQVAAIVSRQVV
jgi:hypothetical protein